MIRSRGRSPVNGIRTLVQKGEHTLTLYHLVRTQWKVYTLQLKQGSLQNLTKLEPWTGTSSLQDCEEIHFCLFISHLICGSGDSSPNGLRHLPTIAASQAGLCTQQRLNKCYRKVLPSQACICLGKIKDTSKGEIVTWQSCSPVTHSRPWASTRQVSRQREPVGRGDWGGFKDSGR